MKKVKLISFLVILPILLMATLAFGQNHSNYQSSVKIRVALSKSKEEVNFLIKKGNYELTEKSSGKVITEIKPGEEWSVRFDGNNSFKITNNKAESYHVKSPVYLNPYNEKETNIFKFEGVKYRDGLLLHNDKESILVVNILDIEKYLYGVVGKEIGGYADMEALKAQAVASRSYALSRYNPDNKYDVGIDVMTQVYGGFDAETAAGGSRVVNAVDATKGEVLFYEGKLVHAFYHSNAGGHTANSEDVWSQSLPYLRGVSSPYDEYAYNFPSQSATGWPANTYKWEEKISRDKLLELISQWNENSDSEDKIEVGEILELNTYGDDIKNSENPSGRVMQMDFVGTEDTQSFYKGNIRRVLGGLRSTKFEINTDAEAYIMSENKEITAVEHGENLKAVSADGNIKEVAPGQDAYKIIGSHKERWLKKRFSQIEISGYGHGHGVGMSQWGARGMAAQDYSYKEILEYYYNQNKQDGKLVIEKYY